MLVFFIVMLFVVWGVNIYKEKNFKKYLLYFYVNIGVENKACGF